MRLLSPVQGGRVHFRGVQHVPQASRGRRTKSQRLCLVPSSLLYHVFGDGHGIVLCRARYRYHVVHALAFGVMRLLPSRGAKVHSSLPIHLLILVTGLHSLCVFQVKYVGRLVSR